MIKDNVNALSNSDDNIKNQISKNIDAKNTKKNYNIINKIFFTLGVVTFSSILFVSYKLKHFERDYKAIPDNIELDWISQYINKIAYNFGANKETNYFQNYIGTFLRGEKSGNYRNTQYAKKIISEKIQTFLEDNNDLKNEFLKNIQFKNFTIDKNNNVKFFIKYIGTNSNTDLFKKLLDIEELNLKFEGNNNYISGSCTLEDTIKGKKLYSLLIPNSGTRYIENEKHDTKCPVMSWEYDMLYRINILYKDSLEKDNKFKENFSESLVHFDDFLKNIIENPKDTNCIHEALIQDPNYFNKNSNMISKESEDLLNKIENQLIDNIDLSKLVKKIGDKWQKLISMNNTSNNVFKHFGVPLIIQKLLSDFNYYNKYNYKLPQIKFNFPYISNNFWCVLDPNDFYQEIQIAVNNGHLENRYYFFDEKKRNEVKAKMLEILELYVSKEQFEYAKNNIEEKIYDF